MSMKDLTPQLPPQHQPQHPLQLLPPGGNQEDVVRPQEVAKESSDMVAALGLRQSDDEANALGLPARTAYSPTERDAERSLPSESATICLGPAYWAEMSSRFPWGTSGPRMKACAAGIGFS